MGTDQRVARIEGAARDVLAACSRMREEGEDARILLEAARDAYLDALDVATGELVREALKGAAA